MNEGWRCPKDLRFHAGLALMMSQKLFVKMRNLGKKYYSIELKVRTFLLFKFKLKFEKQKPNFSRSNQRFSTSFLLKRKKCRSKIAMEYYYLADYVVPCLKCNVASWNDVDLWHHLNYHPHVLFPSNSTTLSLSQTKHFNSCLIAIHNVQNNGLRTPNEAFFQRNPKLLGLGRQFGQINFGVFLGNLSAPILVHW